MKQPKPKNHTFTVKGFIQRGSPHIHFELSFIDGDTIEEAIQAARNIFKKGEPVSVSDVTRIISRSDENECDDNF